MPSTAKQDGLCTLGSFVHHSSTMGCWDVSVLTESFCFTFRQNEVLWREVVSLRQNHSQQQKVINKVVVIQTPNSLVLHGVCSPLTFVSCPIVFSTLWYLSTFIFPVFQIVWCSYMSYEKWSLTKHRLCSWAKDFNFSVSPLYDIRNHFSAKVLRNRVQFSLTFLYCLCYGCTDAFGLPKSFLFPSYKRGASPLCHHASCRQQN